MIETEILIVGGGPAGSITAKKLSQAGVSNILIQRNFGFRKPCGGGIRLDAFEKFGIDRSLIQKKAEKLSLVFQDKRVDLDISQNAIGIVDRVAFDSSLREDAKKEGTTLYEATFISLREEGEYIISTIRKDGLLIEVKSSYLIAADGVNSKIRKLVNGDSVSSFLTHYTDITTQEYDSCEFHFGVSVAKDQYAWAFPHAHGSNIGTVADDIDCLSNLKESLHIKEESRVLGYKIPVYKNNIFYKNRVFFVGDSASQVLPFTYEGIYYAMSSAAILAEVIIKKEDPSSYEKRWNEEHQKKFVTLAKLQKLFLYNDFMIGIMMRLYKKKYIQEQMVKYWLGDRDVDFNYRLLWRFIKRLF